MLFRSILFSLVLGLIVCLIGGAPGPVTGVDAAMLATLGVLAVITIIGRWKVSVHSAVWAGIAAMLTLTFGPWALLTALAVPVVVWGRVHVRDHTLPQALVGTVTGAIVAGTTFALLH